jgi:hypothetical protein
MDVLASGPVSWAIVLEGRSDASGILLLCDDRNELESIAIELRRRGHRVVVHPYPSRVADDQLPVGSAKSS